MTNCKKCGNCCKRFEASLDLEKPCNQVAIASIKKNFAEGPMKMILKNYTAVKLKIEGECQHWDSETKLCKIYENRPEICKNFYCEKSLNS